MTENIPQELLDRHYLVTTKSVKKKRRCLKCRKLMASKDFGNRICPTCVDSIGKYGELAEYVVVS
ncbi:MAG: hypothetical protein D4S01_11470 [Dehalococcoidia bacterium]|nr:MAG: hypothetical protein D4S01_11470 [Dehalococcoidia bacterium]